MDSLIKKKSSDILIFRKFLKLRTVREYTKKLAIIFRLVRWNIALKVELLSSIPKSHVTITTLRGR